MFLAVCRGTPGFYEEKKARYMDEPAFLFCSEPISLSEVEALKAAHAAFFAALRVSEPRSCHPDAPRAGCSLASCPQLPQLEPVPGCPKCALIQRSVGNFLGAR